MFIGKFQNRAQFLPRFQIKTKKLSFQNRAEVFHIHFKAEHLARRRISGDFLFHSFKNAQNALFLILLFPGRKTAVSSSKVQVTDGQLLVVGCLDAVEPLSSG